MRAYERLIKYAKVHTASVDRADTTPSSLCQFDLANILADELKELGATDVSVDSHCYVYGKLPAIAEYSTA